MNKLLLAIILIIPAPIFASEQTYLEMQAYCKASPQGCANSLYSCYMINGEIMAEVRRLDRRVKRMRRIILRLRNEI